jgi:enamine deaminase RidA (YjgF/YER057c/UK114 family)
MYGQAQAIFAKIKHLMEAAGGAMDDIVKVVIFVTDIKRREEVGCRENSPQHERVRQS